MKTEMTQEKIGNEAEERRVEERRIDCSNHVNPAGEKFR